MAAAYVWQRDVVWQKDVVWKQWYDLQTSTTTISNGRERWYLTDEQAANVTYRNRYDEDWWSNHTGTPITWTQVQRHVWDRWEVRERETQEQEAARLQREQELRDIRQRAREHESRQRLAAQQRMAGAQERALELLEMLLTPEEALHRSTHGELRVRGSDGGLFVIEERDSVHGNVREVDEHGCILGRVCVAPAMYDREERAALPLADGWVGQYLAIKYQEERFRDTGNWSGRRPCRYPEVPILHTAA